MADSERLGPAIDTNTLNRPTQRKLVGVWMDDVDLPTLVLPQVRGELTKRPVVSRSFASSDAWLIARRSCAVLRQHGDTPSRAASAVAYAETRSPLMRALPSCHGEICPSYTDAPLRKCAASSRVSTKGMLRG